jgi:hypothetical protein
MADGTKKSLQDSVDNSENLRGENTPSKHLEKYYWKSGVSANPAGRPKGSRNKLGELLFRDFCADWELHGAAAIAELRKNSKLHYVKIAATIIPRELIVREQSIKDLSDEQISEMLTYLSEQMGKDAKVINAEATDIASDGQEE